MASSKLVRVGAVGAAVAAAGYVAMFAVEMTMAGDLDQPLPNVPLVVGLAGTLLAILGLHALQRGSYGRLGMVGFLATFVSSLVALVGLLILVTTDPASSTDVDDLGFIGSVLGRYLSLIGFALLGIATLQAWVLPRWCGWLIAVGLPISMLGLPFIGEGITWALVGYALFRAGGVRRKSPPACAKFPRMN
jgi:hypothetical protein